MVADLDQAVIDEFDFLTFMAGVPRKKGRPPAIRSRGNVLGSVEPNGPAMTFNMGPMPINAHDGSRLPPYRGSKRDIRAAFSKQGPVATINFQVPFGQNRKFLRGITKIAFSSLAFFPGASIALRPEFAPIRNFVRRGVGDRRVLMTFDSDSTYSNRAWPPYVSPSGDHAITFRIAFVEFLVDLSEREALLGTFQSKASEFLGSENWCTLPVTT